jgi:hypothetical protein
MMYGAGVDQNISVPAGRISEYQSISKDHHKQFCLIR